jgi:hypothetical protein
MLAMDVNDNPQNQSPCGALGSSRARSAPMPSPRPTLLCHYRYDPLDRLINQTQPDTPANQRFYCKSRLATEIQGAVQYSIFQRDDQLLAQHLNNHSGHYKPPFKTLKPVRTLLENLGAQVTAIRAPGPKFKAG